MNMPNEIDGSYIKDSEVIYCKRMCTLCGDECIEDIVEELNDEDEE